MPRLIFVDEQVLKLHRLDFPPDAVRFQADHPYEDASRHEAAIRVFRQTVEAAYRPPRGARPGEAPVVVGAGSVVRNTAEDVAELLRREGYVVTLLSGRRAERGLADIRLLEALWGSELCVFVLGDRLSDEHIALAMARSHCIPSVRLQYDPHATDMNPSLSGTVRWRTPSDMLVEFERQLTSYKAGFVQPVEMARASTPVEVARSIGTMKWRYRADNLWAIENGPELIRHVRPDNAFVVDEVSRARREFAATGAAERGRPKSTLMCRLIYSGVQRHRFAYEIELQTGEAGYQAIRTPSQIETHNTATCLDLACLFASLLEAANENPVVVVLEGPGFAHALAGYRAHDEPAWAEVGIGDLRRALTLRDAVLFEATGAVEADVPVGAERECERRDKLLDFADAQAAAARILARNDVRLKHVVDVRHLREHQGAAY